MAGKKRARRKGSSKRRKSRALAVAAGSRSNPPTRSKRRRAHASARRGSVRRAGRRGSRRNPPGLVGAVTGALVDGLTVTGGVVAQNNLVRYVPDLVPATMANAALLNGVIKDLGGIVAGSYLLHRMFGGDRARLVVAGQAHAAIARVLRTMNVPVLSTSLGEYDPMRGAPSIGVYTNGIVRAPVRVPALPAARPNNVATLRGVGIYSDGMSNAPGMF